LTPRILFDVLRRPGWLMQLARRRPPLLINMQDAAERRADAQTLIGAVTKEFDPSVTWDDVAEFRKLWPKAFLVKGILSAEDARKAADIGADGIVVSNHGGRQLDHAVAPLDVLAEIVAAVGDRLVILCDSGFRRGTDILKAIALGARGVLVGRPTLYGCAVAGQAGAARAIAILRTEIGRDLALIGCTSLDQLDATRVRVV